MRQKALLGEEESGIAVPATAPAEVGGDVEREWKLQNQGFSFTILFCIKINVLQSLQKYCCGGQCEILPGLGITFKRLQYALGGLLMPP